VNRKLTLDYGVRFVHAIPQHDNVSVPCVGGSGDCTQSGNFLPDKWVQSSAPALYVPGCVNNTPTCTGTNRSAKNPATGELLGANTSLASGTLIPNSGNVRNGLFQSDGIADTTYTYPS
jgi:hypothetical protein